jgi:hypothetical protein
MKKSFLLMALLGLSSANAEQKINTHDDYLLNAPSDLVSIPTEFSDDLEALLNSSLSIEAAYLHKNDATKPIGYQVSHSDFTGLIGGDNLLALQFDSSSAFPKGYGELLRKYNDSNAFERRRMEKDFQNFLASIESDSPFEMLEGTSALFAVRITGSYPFDFDDMSKSVVVSAEACGENMFSGDAYGTTRIAVNPFGKPHDQKCLVTVKFDDVDTAELFEEAVNESQISAFVKATYLGYGTYESRLAIGDELVFTKRKVEETHTYKVDAYASGPNAGKTVTEKFFSFEYITAIQPLENTFASENLMATMPSYKFSNDESVFSNFKGFVDFISQSNATVGNSNISFRVDEAGDIELALFKRANDKLFGAVGKYDLVNAGARTFAVLKSQYQAGMVLPRVLIPESVSQRELSLESLAGDLSYSIKTSRWAPADHESILNEFGYSEDKLTSVSTGFPYDSTVQITTASN